MEIKSTDLVGLFEKSLQDVPQEHLDEIGIVVQVGDNIARVYGLRNAVYGELIEFEGSNRGIIFNLDEETVAVFLLYNTVAVVELEVAKRTGSVFKTPVGMLSSPMKISIAPKDSGNPTNGTARAKS